MYISVLKTGADLGGYLPPPFSIRWKAILKNHPEKSIYYKFKPKSILGVLKNMLWRFFFWITEKTCEGAQLYHDID